MLQLLEFGICVVCVGKLGELEQIVNIFSFTDCGRDRRGEQILDCVEQYPELLLWGNRSVSGMSLCETGQLIQFCVDWVMCLSEYSSMHMHACFQLSLSCLTSHEHRRSTLTQVPSQVSNHFALLSSSWCRCVETPLSSTVSQSMQNLCNYWSLLQAGRTSSSCRCATPCAASRACRKLAFLHRWLSKRRRSGMRSIFLSTSGAVSFLVILQPPESSFLASRIEVALSISDTLSVRRRWCVKPGCTSLRKDVFQFSNCVTCGHVSNATSSNSFLFRVDFPSWDRMSERVACKRNRWFKRFLPNELNRIVDNQIINEQEDVTCTEDNQITEIEGHVKTLSNNQSLLSSPQDSIEGLATPQEADLDDEQIRALLASPRYLVEREASAERS